MLIEINIKQVIFSELIIVFANNQKIIKLTENFVFQKRTKHITIKYHYIRDLIKHEDVQLIYKTIDQMIVDELIKSLKSILFKRFVTSLDMISVIEASIFEHSIFEKSTLNQLIKNEERVDHNHWHEDLIVEHIVDHSDHDEHIANSDHQRHDDDIVEHDEHIVDHNDLERHIADHSDHEKRSSTEKHFRERNERRIKAHREHFVINERWIETRERQSIIEEHRIDEHSDDHN